MIKRKPGFMGLAEQNARVKKSKKPMSQEQQQFRQQLGQQMQGDRAQEQGMVDKMSAFNRMQQDKQKMMELPQEYEPSQGGEMETLAYVNPKEMEMLKRSGGSGEMTEYGVPSFYTGSGNPNQDKADEKTNIFGNTVSGETQRKEHQRVRDSAGSGGGGNSGGGNDYGAAQEARAAAKAEREAAAEARRVEKEKVTKEREAKREGYIEGEMTDSKGRTADDPKYDASTAEMKGGYEGYKGEYAGLGEKAKDITGKFGKTAGEMEAYAGTVDPVTGKRTGGFAGLGEDIRGLGEEGQDYFQGAVDPVTGKRTGGAAQAYKDAAGKGVTAAGTGVTAATQAAKDIKTAAGEGKTAAGLGQTAATDAVGKIGTATQLGVDAAGRGEAAAGIGATGFQEGAEDVAGVQKRFGEEGYEKDVGGYESKIAAMGERAMSGDVGQREAAMLKGQMEEGRMAAQKGSEEKLRRSMAQSGASPAEIASKVAQFQKQSASQQAQAGRSESLSSQLQGQQMGQSQLGQAAGFMGQGAGMTGQRAGMAGQQASLGAQQAALRGQGAAMNMQGAQMGMSGAQMGLQGAQAAGQMGMQGAQMGMQGAQMGIQGAQAAGQMGLAGAGMGMQGAQMGMQGVQGAGQMYGQGQASAMQGMQGQGQMMGQGLGALQAATGARAQQMAGVGVQSGMIDQQAGMTQAQLNDVMAQQTQAYQAEQTQAQRDADAAASAGGGGGGNKGFFGNLFSDIRLKDNIQLLQEGKDGDPNIYSFKYKWDTDTTWSGVMAQELLNTKHADAVEINPDGFYMVDYHKLGIPMTQLSIKE